MVRPHHMKMNIYENYMRKRKDAKVILPRLNKCILDFQQIDTLEQFAEFIIMYGISYASILLLRHPP